jgi:hypothetical protein
VCKQGFRTSDTDHGEEYRRGLDVAFISDSESSDEGCTVLGQCDIGGNTNEANNSSEDQREMLLLPPRISVPLMILIVIVPQTYGS